MRYISFVLIMCSPMVVQVHGQTGPFDEDSDWREQEPFCRVGVPSICVDIRCWCDCVYTNYGVLMISKKKHYCLPDEVCVDNGQNGTSCVQIQARRKRGSVALNPGFEISHEIHMGLPDRSVIRAAANVLKAKLREEAQRIRDNADSGQGQGQGLVLPGAYQTVTENTYN